MKVLTLIRHAKSGPSAPRGGDRERSITDRGRADARMMGALLARDYPVPEMILGSSARRVKETLAGLLESYDGEYPQPHIEEQLYLAEADILQKQVAAAFESVDDLWLCGHNPGLSVLIGRLCDAEIDDMPTLGIVRITFSDTTSVYSGNGELLWYDTPRNHRG